MNYRKSNILLLILVAILLNPAIAKKPSSKVYRGFTSQGYGETMANYKSFDFEGNDMSTIMFQYDVITPKRINDLIEYDPNNKALKDLFNTELVSVLITPKAVAKNYGGSFGAIGSLVGSAIAYAKASMKPHEQFYDTKMINPKDFGTVCRPQEITTGDFNRSIAEQLDVIADRKGSYGDAKYLNSRYAIATYDPNCFTKTEKTQFVIAATGYGETQRPQTYDTISKKLKKQVKSDFGII